LLPKTPKPHALIIKSAVLGQEEGVDEGPASEEGLGEVGVVFRCPEVSLPVFTLSILVHLHCGVSWIGQPVQQLLSMRRELEHTARGGSGEHSQTT